MTKSNYELDRESRRKIVENLDINYFVEASAGSGKTSSLVNRMVALVESGKCTVDEICTITFTKAAANEFFERFQKLLSLRSNPETVSELAKHLRPGDLPRTTPESRARAQAALLNIDACFMGTIDAFCNMLAHELPKELSIPSFASVISEEEEIELIKNEFYKILIDENNSLHEKAKIFDSLFNRSNDSFAKAVSELIDYRDYNFIYNKNFLDPTFDLENYFNVQLNKKYILEYLDFLFKNEIPFGDADVKKAYKSLKSSWKKLSANNDKWSKCVIDVVSAAKGISKIEIKNKLIPFIDNLSKYYDVNGKEIDEKPELTKVKDNLLKFVNDYKHSVLMDLVKDALPIISENFRAKGKLTFTDYLMWICKAFKNSASGDRKLIEHITSRHKYFMLDESQDTNPAQTQLFFFLNSTVKTTDWEKAEPREGSLFIVGDPKQSIYGFRNADVNAYNKTKAIFQAKNEYLLLFSNYRSNKSLIEYFNGTMPRLLASDEQPLGHADIPLESIDNDRIDVASKSTLDGVYYYDVAPIKGVRSPRKCDSIEVIKLVSKLYNKENIFIGVKDENGYVNRKVRFSDFMIVPRNTTMEDYVNKCEELNIPVIIEGKQNYKNCDLLVSLKDILYLLGNPRDSILLIKVLMGPFFKLNEIQIANVIQNKETLSIVEENSLVSPVGDALNLLNAIYSNTRGMSNSAKMMYMLNCKELKAFEKIGARKLEYFFFYVELLREREATGELNSNKKLMKFTEDFLDNNTDHERCLRFKNKVDAIKIANLHKVKGLQAPIVILCEPYANTFSPTHAISDNDLYVFEISAGANSGNLVQTDQYDIPQKELASKVDEAESRRIQYVGATRPESTLIIGNYLKENTPSRSNPWKDLLDCSSSKRDIKTVVGDSKENEEIGLILPIKEAEMSDVLTSESLVSINEENNKGYKSVTPSKMDHKLTPRSTNNDDIHEKEESTINSSLVGTLVHRLMQCLVESREKANIKELINQIIDEYGGEEYLTILEEVAETITCGGYKQTNGCFPDDILRTLLSAKQVLCEVPFSYFKNNELIHGIMDCVFEDDSGWHILDYKTNTESDVKVLMEEHYAEQMAAYKQAFKEITGEDSTVGIYHINCK